MNRWQPTGKCRAERAHVVSIVDRQGNRYKVATAPTHDRDFKYHVGKLVKPHSFNGSSGKDCGAGINFFRNKEEAWQWVRA